MRRSILPHVTPVVIPALAVNGGLSLSQTEFNATLGNFMGESQVMIGFGHQTAVTISINNHSQDGVHISWTFTWQPKEGESYETDRQCVDDARKVPQQFFDRLQLLGPLAESFKTILSPDTAHRTAKYNWLMRHVHVPLSELLQSASNRTALIGDAAHAMPIVGGEGANHALLDGIELGEAIAAHRNPCEAVEHFYQQQHDRWAHGVEHSIKQFSSLHRPIEKWQTEAPN